MARASSRFWAAFSSRTPGRTSWSRCARAPRPPRRRRLDSVAACAGDAVRAAGRRGGDSRRRPCFRRGVVCRARDDRRGGAAHARARGSSQSIQTGSPPGGGGRGAPGAAGLGAAVRGQSRDARHGSSSRPSCPSSPSPPRSTSPCASASPCTSTPRRRRRSSSSSSSSAPLAALRHRRRWATHPTAAGTAWTLSGYCPCACCCPRRARERAWASRRWCVTHHRSPRARAAQLTFCGFFSVRGSAAQLASAALLTVACTAAWLVWRWQARVCGRGRGGGRRGGGGGGGARAWRCGLVPRARSLYWPPQDRRRALSWGPSGYAARLLGARVARWLGSPEEDVAVDGRVMYGGAAADAAAAGAREAGGDQTGDRTAGAHSRGYEAIAIAGAYSRGYEAIAIAARTALSRSSAECRPISVS